ncbi:hypothetical protein ABZ372_34590 [Streptomyces sp. NPDC005921]|uniref:hypothetical protein n=1 Tax=Streptomyces sp. NPDC005827 TaxID=3157070 RepID=UPI003400BADD
MLRLRLKVIDWPRKALVLTDTPRRDCVDCDGAGGFQEDYAYPDNGEYWGTGWAPCSCWSQRRLTLLPLPRWARRTPPGGYSDVAPF